MPAPENLNDLQSVLRMNAELVTTVEQLQQTNRQLREELDLYRRKFFGQSSERHVEDDSQLYLFDSDSDSEAMAEIEEELQEQPTPPRRRRRKKKSEKLPAHLPRRIIEADVAANQRDCPCCGEEMPITGTDINERLDMEPAKSLAGRPRRCPAVITILTTCLTSPRVVVVMDLRIFYRTFAVTRWSMHTEFMRVSTWEAVAGSWHAAATRMRAGSLSKRSPMTRSPVRVRCRFIAASTTSRIALVIFRWPIAWSCGSRNRLGSCKIFALGCWRRTMTGECFPRAR